MDLSSNFNSRVILPDISNCCTKEKPKIKKMEAAKGGKIKLFVAGAYY